MRPSLVAIILGAALGGCASSDDSAADPPPKSFVAGPESERGSVGRGLTVQEGWGGGSASTTAAAVDLGPCTGKVVLASSFDGAAPSDGFAVDGNTDLLSLDRARSVSAPSSLRAALGAAELDFGVLLKSVKSLPDVDLCLQMKVALEVSGPPTATSQVEILRLGLPGLGDRERRVGIAVDARGPFVTSLVGDSYLSARFTAPATFTRWTLRVRRATSSVVLQTGTSAAVTLPIDVPTGVSAFDLTLGIDGSLAREKPSVQVWVDDLTISTE